MNDLRVRIYAPDKQMYFLSMEDLLFETFSKWTFEKLSIDLGTHMKDEKGREIFENDILGYGDNYPCLVHYDRKTCRWLAIEQGNKDGIRYHEMDAYTVPWIILGNIHQNPLLLKEHQYKEQ